MKRNRETTLLLCDRQQSVLCSTTPQQRTTIAYNPFGHGACATLGFNGELPERCTGHYLLGGGYRAYNPILMRFNSLDSWSPFGRGGLNPYAYCLGDPINHRDPIGHFAWGDGLSIVVGLLGIAILAKEVQAGERSNTSAHFLAADEWLRTGGTSGIVGTVFNSLGALGSGVIDAGARKTGESIRRTLT